MELTGKLVKIKIFTDKDYPLADMWEDISIPTEATISLSPPTSEEIRKLKEGDEVLVRRKVIKDDEGNFALLGYDKKPFNTVVAILPHSTLTPKTELPEELNLPCFVHDYFMQDTFVGEALQALNDHIGMLESKLNQLIRYLKEREKC